MGQKNGDIVRTPAFRYHYDTPAEIDLLNQLWERVNLGKNFFLPTKKATGWRTTNAGRNTRVYDEPLTPHRRPVDAGILSEEQSHDLQVIYERTNPAELTRTINRIQHALIDSAKDKTLALREQAP